MRRRGILLWLIGPSAVLLGAQSVPAATIAGYKHTGWTTENGAPTPLANIAQSPDGFLWMATGTGVYRFDGVSFEKIPSLRDPELGDLPPAGIHLSASGDIWIGYRTGAVAVYHHGILRDLHMPDPPGYVTGFEDDGTGGVWILSDRSHNPLRYFKSGRWTAFGEAQGVPADQVHQVFISRDGTTWAVQSNTLLMLRRGSISFETTPATLTTGAEVAQGPDGRLWLADRLGARPLPDYPRGETGAATPESNAAIGGRRHLAFDREGNLWGTGASTGLFRISAAALNDRSGRANPDTFKAEDGLTSNGARSLLVDREGTIWIATSNGLDRMRRAAVRSQPGITGESAAYGGGTDGHGVVYVMDDAGVYAIMPGQPAKLISPLVGDVSTPCRRADGSLAIVAPDVLYRVLPDRLIGSPSRFGAASACAEDALGRLWVIGAGDELSWLGHGGGWHTLTNPREAASAIDLMPGQPGDVIANLGSRSLLWLDPTRPKLVRAARLGVGAISSVNRGQSGLRVSGSRGLARFRGDTVQVISGERYPWLSRLKGLIETRRGDTWMLSPYGIVRVTTRDLDRAFDHPDSALPYQLFDAADGLTGRMQKNGLLGAQIFEGADNVMRFLTSAGVVMIDPATLTQNLLPPPVVVTSLTSGGMKYPDPTNVTLRPGASNVEIAYSALSLSVPERVRFRYRLEGVDDGWIDPGRRREAVYGNLGPGTYRFRVIAANNDGVWNTAGATLGIEVPPTFVQSIWFKMLGSLVVIAALWWAYSIRVREVTGRLNAVMGVRLAERERIARELHDTLLQTFQGLVLQFQAAANRVPAGGPARQAIEQALRRADVALAEGRDRVRELRDEGVGGDLTRSWTAIAAELGADRSVRFELTVEGRAQPLYPLVREELQRLGEEALRNAFRHAQASAIEMSLTCRADRLRFDIRDDGVGLPKDVAATGERPGHYGLTGMRERARRIGGTLTIVSRDGVGTEILFSMAGNAAYTGRDRRWWLQPIQARNWGMRR